MRIMLLSSLSVLTLVSGFQTRNLADTPNSSTEKLASLSALRDDSTDAAQPSPLDTASYDSALWRTEYLPSTKNQQRANTADAEAPTDSGAVQSISQGSDTPRGHDALLARFMNNDATELAAISIPLLTDSSNLFPDAEADEMSREAMSDLEYAAIDASQHVKNGYTASGPSATSALVAVAGILILIGAYLPSVRRWKN